MTTSSATVVAGIGSCRILTPLLLLERKGRIATRAGSSAAWYTHSTADALQKIEIITGHRQLSEAEVPLVVHGLHKWQPDTHRPDLLDDVTTFVVEIASLKLIDYQGLEIQRWCLRDILIEQKVPVEPFLELLSHDVGQRDLSLLPDTASDQVRDIAARAVAVRQTPEMLIEGLKSIEKRLGRPLVLVPHINVEGGAGALIPERVILADALKQFCDAAPGRTYFDPAIHVRAYGISAALKDLGHYNPPFEHVMGDLMAPLLKANSPARSGVAA